MPRPLSEETKQAIKAYLKRFVEGLIQESRGRLPEHDAGNASTSEREMIKPFHQAILPPRVRAVSEFERSFSLFFEIKSPQPNKGQCLEVMQRLLRIHLARQKPRPQVQAYFAMPYNPYGETRSDYRWRYAIDYTPFEDTVRIGDEFWSLVGTDSTYTELLQIYTEVGQECEQAILQLFR